ncbi:MAG TPA: bacillithiol biosynthesis BshC [Thermoanaerobaculia bacterium]|nr:bacillithiol biosynthesis BshC [Thermoanaerobaculia bacterium]
MTILEQRDVRVEFPLADYPSIGRFALDLVEGSRSAARFCRRADWARLGPMAPSRDRSPLAAALERTNRAWGNELGGLLDPWIRGEAVGIVAGQQAGFAGGPLYTLTKIATLIAIRRRLGQRGVPAVPFFWLATEDHDFDEVARVVVQRGGERVALRASESPAIRCPVGMLPLPDSLREGLASLLGKAPRWLRPGISFGDSFAELVVDAVGSGELVLIDSLLPELRREGGDLLHRIAGRLTEAEEAIDRRSRELDEAGYAPQVTRGAEGHYSLLYTIEDDGARIPVLPREIGIQRALERIEKVPETVSTGVLARPLLQDAVLEPEVFVGGPAEVAYYAQLGGLHEMFGVRAPAVALRGHVLVAPAKRLRALERHGVEIQRIFEPLEEVLLPREPEAVAELDRAVEQADRALAEAAQAIASVALGADPGLDRSLQRSRRSIAHHLGRMAHRARRAVARRDRERWDALRSLQEILVPDGRVQDRVAGWIGWWEDYGPRLVSRLVAEAEPDATVVRVAGL